MRNKKFFDTLDREAQSYWLGFFCADGGFHSNLKQFGFQLARKDRDHLVKLATIFSREVKDGSTFDERTKRRYFWSKLTIHSVHMIRKMIAFGLPLNKTEHLTGDIFSKIPPQQLSHFVRGYFDGDGCISHIGKAEYRITIVGTYDFLDKMRDSINEVLAVAFPTPHKRGRVLHGIALCGTDRINTLKEWMYADATVFMERKKEIFDKVPSHRGASRHKGVYRRNNSWVARVYENKRMRTIKQCKTEEEAAAVLREYNQKKAA